MIVTEQLILRPPFIFSACWRANARMAPRTYLGHAFPCCLKILTTWPWPRGLTTWRQGLPPETKEIRAHEREYTISSLRQRYGALRCKSPCRPVMAKSRCMLHARIRKSASILLATLLLTAAVAPPPVRHVHARAESGKSHHRHDVSRVPSHGHEHHGEGPGHHLAESDVDTDSGHWWHLHFYLLGFEFTLPEPTSDQSDRESQAKQTVSLLASDQQLFPCRTTRVVSALPLIHSPTFCWLTGAAPMPVLVAASAPVSHPPLCDVARRERSGVLRS
jgi:hypothetical protein